ncbi:MAG TPA: hypothetical protein VGN54_12430 [Mycobacteriales bacterium]|jgi:hypothetical protein|nr:hypothetical protein [Mycobacteriales bacterium]
MDQSAAEHAVEQLRARAVMAHVASTGLYRFGIRVVLPDGREALWDADGTAGIEAQVLRDGILTGFIPTLPGSADWDVAQIVEAIAGIDYDDPASNDIGSIGPVQRPPMAERGGLQETRPRTTGPLREPGLARRFTGLFRPGR